MSRPPAARLKALRAFAALVVAAGERGATLDAVAREAGISKGGLLYHFANREDLIAGLADHLRTLLARDIQAMGDDPLGATAYLLRTSARFDDAFAETYIAVVALAQTGHTSATQVLAEADQAWLEAVTQEIGDPHVARMVVLLCDGIYTHAAVQRGPTGHDVDALHDLITELLAARRE